MDSLTSSLNYYLKRSHTRHYHKECLFSKKLFHFYFCSKNIQEYNNIDMRLSYDDMCLCLACEDGDSWQLNPLSSRLGITSFNKSFLYRQKFKFIQTKD